MSPVAVLWGRDGGLLRFRLLCFRTQQHRLFLPFFQVLFLTFPNICLQYHVLLHKKLMLVVTAKIYSWKIPIAFRGNSGAELDILEKSL